jgi:hypothetical protein
VATLSPLPDPWPVLLWDRANNPQHYDEQGRIKRQGHHIQIEKTSFKGWHKRYGTSVKKPLSQRWHQCSCGIGPVQRDLYSACLLAYLDPADHLPSIAQHDWAGVEARLTAAMEELFQRARNGHPLPRSFGLTGARARQPQSLAPNRQEPPGLLVSPPLEALGLAQEPLLL